MARAWNEGDASVPHTATATDELPTSSTNITVTTNGSTISKRLGGLFGRRSARRRSKSRADDSVLDDQVWLESNSLFHRNAQGNSNDKASPGGPPYLMDEASSPSSSTGNATPTKRGSSELFRTTSGPAVSKTSESRAYGNDVAKKGHHHLRRRSVAGVTRKLLLSSGQSVPQSVGHKRAASAGTRRQILRPSQTMPRSLLARGKKKHVPEKSITVDLTPKPVPMKRRRSMSTGSAASIAARPRVPAAAAPTVATTSTGTGAARHQHQRLKPRRYNTLKTLNKFRTLSNTLRRRKSSAADSAKSYSCNGKGGLSLKDPSPCPFDGGSPSAGHLAKKNPSFDDTSRSATMLHVPLRRARTTERPEYYYSSSSDSESSPEVAPRQVRKSSAPPRNSYGNMESRYVSRCFTPLPGGPTANAHSQPINVFEKQGPTVLSQVVQQSRLSLAVPTSSTDRNQDLVVPKFSKAFHASQFLRNHQEAPNAARVPPYSRPKSAQPSYSHDQLRDFTAPTPPPDIDVPPPSMPTSRPGSALALVKPPSYPPPAPAPVVTNSNSRPFRLSAPSVCSRYSSSRRTPVDTSLQITGIDVPSKYSYPSTAAESDSSRSQTPVFHEYTARPYQHHKFSGKGIEMPMLQLRRKRAQSSTVQFMAPTPPPEIEAPPKPVSVDGSAPATFSPRMTAILQNRAMKRNRRQAGEPPINNFYQITPAPSFNPPQVPSKTDDGCSVAQPRPMRQQPKQVIQGRVEVETRSINRTPSLHLHDASMQPAGYLPPAPSGVVKLQCPVPIRPKSAVGFYLPPESLPTPPPAPAPLLHSEPKALPNVCEDSVVAPPSRCANNPLASADASVQRAIEARENFVNETRTSQSSISVFGRRPSSVFTWDETDTSTRQNTFTTEEILQRANTLEFCMSRARPACSSAQVAPILLRSASRSFTASSFASSVSYTGRTSVGDHTTVSGSVRTVCHDVPLDEIPMRPVPPVMSYAPRSPDVHTPSSSPSLSSGEEIADSISEQRDHDVDIAGMSPLDLNAASAAVVAAARKEREQRKEQKSNSRHLQAKRFFRRIRAGEARARADRERAKIAAKLERRRNRQASTTPPPSVTKQEPTAKVASTRRGAAETSISAPAPETSTPSVAIIAPKPKRPAITIDSTALHNRSNSSAPSTSRSGGISGFTNKFFPFFKRPQRGYKPEQQQQQHATRKILIQRAHTQEYEQTSSYSKHHQRSHTADLDTVEAPERPGSTPLFMKPQQHERPKTLDRARGKLLSNFVRRGKPQTLDWTRQQPAHKRGRAQTQPNNLPFSAVPLKFTARSSGDFPPAFSKANPSAQADPHATKPETQKLATQFFNDMRSITRSRQRNYTSFIQPHNQVNSQTASGFFKPRPAHHRVEMPSRAHTDGAFPPEQQPTPTTVAAPKPNSARERLQQTYRSQTLPQQGRQSRRGRFMQPEIDPARQDVPSPKSGFHKTLVKQTKFFFKRMDELDPAIKLAAARSRSLSRARQSKALHRRKPRSMTEAQLSAPKHHSRSRSSVPVSSETSSASTASKEASSVSYDLPEKHSPTPKWNSLQTRARAISTPHPMVLQMNSPDHRTMITGFSTFLWLHINESQKAMLEERSYGKYCDKLYMPRLYQHEGAMPRQDEIYYFLKSLLGPADLSPECYAIAVMFIHRMLKHSHHSRIDSDNWVAFTFTSLMIAQKVWDDVSWTNDQFLKNYTDRYGKIFSPPQVNQLEVDFLSALGFDCSVCPPEYEHYFALLCQLGEKRYVPRHMLREYRRLSETQLPFLEHQFDPYHRLLHHEASATRL